VLRLARVWLDLQYRSTATSAAMRRESEKGDRQKKESTQRAYEEPGGRDRERELCFFVCVCVCGAE
jgi:hypothetical protein